MEDRHHSFRPAKAISYSLAVFVFQSLLRRSILETRLLFLTYYLPPKLVWVTYVAGHRT
jgi:hypothetical protein